MSIVKSVEQNRKERRNMKMYLVHATSRVPKATLHLASSGPLALSLSLSPSRGRTLSRWRKQEILNRNLDQTMNYENINGFK